jgi:hypothetical protein
MSPLGVTMLSDREDLYPNQRMDARCGLLRREALNADMESAQSPTDHLPGMVRAAFTLGWGLTPLLVSRPGIEAPL